MQLPLQSFKIGVALAKLLLEATVETRLVTFELGNVLKGVFERAIK